MAVRRMRLPLRTIARNFSNDLLSTFWEFSHTQGRVNVWKNAKNSQSFHQIVGSSWNSLKSTEIRHFLLVFTLSIFVCLTIKLIPKYFLLWCSFKWLKTKSIHSIWQFRSLRFSFYVVFSKTKKVNFGRFATKRNFRYSTRENIGN